MIPKNYIVFLLLLSLFSGPLRAGDFETHYGIGVVRIVPYNYFTLSFWKKPGIVDLYDFEEVYFCRDSVRPVLHFQFATMDPDSMPKWFLPEIFILSPETQLIQMTCVEKEGNWCKVIANKITGEYKWVELGHDVQFLDWNVFFKIVASVEIIPAQPLLYEQIPPPGRKGKKIPNRQIKNKQEANGRQVLLPKDVQGYWMMVEVKELDENGAVTASYSGWIKWRDETTMLVSYNVVYD